MILRPRQVTFVDRCHAALMEHGNTLGIATVGFGKTISMSAVNAKYGRSVTLQHRIELLDQNRSKFQKVVPDAQTATFAGSHKRWARHGHTFAMMQTLSTAASIERMEPVDIVTVDEAHHSPAESYLRIFERARQLNPDVRFFGVTATPDRVDGKGMRPTFTNVADIVQLREMIEAGFLVPPRTFIIEIEGMAESISYLKKGKSDYNMDAAAQLLDVEPVTDKVVEEWMRLAHDRKTIGFATTVAHSKHMTEAFRLAGVAVEHVDGTTPPGQRKAIWKRLKTGETQMVWNCAVATEGFDEQSVGCVILNRPSMHRSTMVQMIGRGLRIITEPETYPGIVKKDCIVLDFGASLLTHGSLEVEADIDGRQLGKGEAPMKDCPQCETSVPAGVRVCPLCGHEFITEDQEGKAMIGNFRMTEIDIMNISPFHWQDLWDGVVTVAEALTASVVIANYRGTFFAYGIRRGQRTIDLLARSTDKAMGLARGDDYLRHHGDVSAAKKTKRWLTEPLSDKQAELLGEPKHNGVLFSAPAINRYVASCRITWQFNEEKIRRSILTQLN